MIITSKSPYLAPDNIHTYSSSMRIVFDHGMGAMLAAGKSRDSVMIIHTGEGARKHQLENGIPANPRQTDNPAGPDSGIRIPGTELVMASSEAAKHRDAEVRGHEKAHLRALGPYAASGINLTTRRGPDGQSFAVGGSVKVDTSPVPGDPEATIQKARSIIHAATAPGDPSAADMAVAANAYRMASKAAQEIRTKDLFA
jgi:hypothetical protein